MTSEALLYASMPRVDIASQSEAFFLEESRFSVRILLNIMFLGTTLK